MNIHKSINKDKLVILFAGNIRSTINSITSSFGEDQSFIEELSKISKIKNQKEWHSICSAMDLLEDTEYAKESFIKFGLSGPTKYEELGEKYLRLYGVLNAAYLQMESVLKLMHFAGIVEMKKERTELSKMEIIKFRHIAGSHTLNCLEDDKQIHSYMIAQFSLHEKSMQVMDDFNNFKNIDLLESINNFNEKICVKLFQVLVIFCEIVKLRNISEYEKIQAEIIHIKRSMDGEMYMEISEDVSYSVNM